MMAASRGAFAYTDAGPSHLAHTSTASPGYVAAGVGNALGHFDLDDTAATDREMEAEFSFLPPHEAP